MDPGDLLTRWTVRVALTLYLLSLILRIRAGNSRRGLDWARLAWTGGYVAFLLHLAAAFHFVHHWSHVAAFEETARRTEEAIGLAFGEGVHVNYAFTLVWGADVCWWWLRRASYESRPRAVEWTVQGFLAFIAFNSTVVFGTGAIRWAGWAACLLLVAVIGYTYWRGPSELRKENPC